jgi:hypothetical protein
VVPLIIPKVRWAPKHYSTSWLRLSSAQGPGEGFKISCSKTHEQAIREGLPDAELRIYVTWENSLYAPSAYLHDSGRGTDSRITFGAKWAVGVIPVVHNSITIVHLLMTGHCRRLRYCRGRIKWYKTLIAMNIKLIDASGSEYPDLSC